ncbi:MAG TPA: hypothetical protein VGZ26_00395 [Pirellulales bacterium]|jgi:hypothetical protein|nr:hypothetical protein [Pirellulales bacterium]
MRKLLKIAAIVAAAVLIVAGVSLFSVYEASRQVPEFYRHAIASDPAGQQKARDEFVASATALASDLHHGGRWQSLFTADQINAWLALELAKNYPELMPGDLRDPRIVIRDNEATIACRHKNGEVASVLSLTVDAYLQEPNVLALRIRRARAGALPVPLGQVLDGISHAARQLNLRLEWRKLHGDPVALITFSRPHSTGSEALGLQAIELRQGELFLAGTNVRDDSSPSPAVPRPDGTPTASGEKPEAAHPLVGATKKDTRQE